MEFKGLKEHEAFQLLMKVADITPPWDPPTEVAGNEITKTLGYLALAVISAGNAIYKKVCHITEYLRFFRLLLENRRGKKDWCSTDGTDMRYTENDDIFTAFDFSFQYIEAQKTVPSSDAIEILNISLRFYSSRHLRKGYASRARATAPIVSRIAPSTTRQCFRRSLETTSGSS